MAQERIFDRPHYRLLDQARFELLRKCLPEWKARLGLETAWDIGCGLGTFSTLLMELGFRTRAMDGREENATEAGRRNPGAEVCVADVEDPALAAMGPADIVLCLGLLYHLENPFRTVRSLYRLTGKILVVESVCTDDEHPTLLLVDEGPTEDQGLRHIAFYPSEACLIKMFYRAGFTNVFRFVHLPRHTDFQPERGGRKVRTMLVASHAEFSSPYLRHVSEMFGHYEPWASYPSNRIPLAGRIGHFVTKPWTEKAATMRRMLGLQRQG